MTEKRGVININSKDLPDTGHKAFPLNDTHCAIRAALCPDSLPKLKDFEENHKCDKKILPGGFITFITGWRFEVYNSGIGACTLIVCGCGLKINLSDECDHW